MLLIKCPYCGDRPEVEFRHAGEAHIARPADPSKLDDERWCEYLYIRTNYKGLVYERWHHSHGCARFFNAMRHSLSDKFLATYKIGEERPSPPAESERVP
jgi:sarcosine oxidase subunit delta